MVPKVTAINGGAIQWTPVAMQDLTGETPSGYLACANAYGNMHSLGPYNKSKRDYSSPAIQAVKKHATFPAIMALTATLARSGFLCGAIAPRPPNCIPIDPMLANPHKA